MQVTITYAAFDKHVDQMNMERRPGDRVIQRSQTATIDLPDCFAEHMEQEDRDRYVAELVFDNTNTYEGPLWNRFEPILPLTRTHTALSSGDFVTIDNRRWFCDSFGWSRV
jgi:hypothetical protein